MLSLVDRRVVAVNLRGVDYLLVPVSIYGVLVVCVPCLRKHVCKLVVAANLVVAGSDLGVFLFRNRLDSP